MDKKQIELLQMLADRLERLNVDSKWARRASGTRRSLIKFLEEFNQNNTPSPETVEKLVQKSHELLSKAAHEIPEHNETSETFPK